MFHIKMFFFFIGFVCGILAAQEVPAIPKIRPFIKRGIEYISKSENASDTGHDSASDTGHND